MSRYVSEIIRNYGKIVAPAPQPVSVRDDLRVSSLGLVDINCLLVVREHRASVGEGAFGEAWTMESNERYYRRRAVEERMAAQRAMTEQARAWHAKLAAEFAERAQVGTIIATA
jgi:hypothetical protein